MWKKAIIISFKSTCLMSSSFQSGSQKLCQFSSYWFQRQTRFPSCASASRSPQRRIQTANSLSSISLNSTARWVRRRVRWPICVFCLLFKNLISNFFFFVPESWAKTAMCATQIDRDSVVIGLESGCCSYI